jgi:Tfp pilus assembly protein PilP
MSDDDLKLTMAKIRAAIKERVESLPPHQEFLEECSSAS